MVLIIRTENSHEYLMATVPLEAVNLTRKIDNNKVVQI